LVGLLALRVDFSVEGLEVGAMGFLGLEVGFLALDLGGAGLGDAGLTSKQASFGFGLPLQPRLLLNGVVLVQHRQLAREARNTAAQSSRQVARDLRVGPVDTVDSRRQGREYWELSHSVEIPNRDY